MSLCSQECSEGFAKHQEGTQKCCFRCTICQRGTYINSTVNPHNCISCKETEWSEAGSTSCNHRLVAYIPFSHGWAVVIILGALIFVGLTAAISALFMHNYKSPIVKSAGGPIIAAKYPILLSWWKKYHGQWLVVIVVSVIQASLLISGYSSAPPKPGNITLPETQTITLCCDQNFQAMSGFFILFSVLCCLCFIFSYMGKELPKNYNEAKSITFCFLLLVIIWIMYATTHLLHHTDYTSALSALAILSSLYSFLLWYFLPKCYIIVFEPQKNTQQYFLSLIQSYSETSC
ncbi:taste receptor type 1 member 2-like [Anableps anableps]